MTTISFPARHAKRSVSRPRARCWPGKAELPRAAVDAYVAGGVLSTPDADSLRGDLLAVTPRWAAISPRSSWP